MSEPISVSTASSFLKGLKFIFVSYVISIALIALVSAIVVYTDAPEAICIPSVRVVTFFGAFLASFLTARGITSRGWPTGALIAGLYIALLMLFGVAMLGADIFTLHNLTMILFGVISGMAGEIIGVNTSR